MNFSKNDFIFLPLGGSDEIGMNANLYHFNGSWILVDLGISFADDNMTGIDILLPDLSFLEDKMNNLKAIFLTHGHEDHMGAIQYLWQKINVPIYGSSFTIGLLKRKLKENRLLNNLNLKTFVPSEEINIGPFSVKPLRITHSIPDPCSFLIKTKVGNIFHTGDWKFDSNPLVGKPTDIDELKTISEDGILGIVGDSTNSMVEGKTQSEEVVFKDIEKLISESTGKVFITCFASNLARIKSIIQASRKNNKEIILAGKAIERIIDVAQELGYLEKDHVFPSLNKIKNIPKNKIVIIAAGSQGESRSAMTRIAQGRHDKISAEEGDIAIFSSSQIPGNELAIARVHDSFISNGIEVITDKDALIHVSGHPGKEDIAELYNILKPKISIPVHGTKRHIKHHGMIAKNCNVNFCLEPVNGSIIKISHNSPEILGNIETGAVIPDGTQLIDKDSIIFSQRRKMLWNGSVSASVIIDESGDVVSPIQLFQNGLTEGDSEREWFSETLEEIEESIFSLNNSKKLDDSVIKDSIRKSIKYVTKTFFSRDPIINIHVIRING